MAKTPPWMSPLARQCFVILGVSLGMTSTSHVMGFTSVMLPQLRLEQDISDDEASWIVSINGISLFVGLLTTPALMARYGRRTLNLTRCLILVVTFGALFLATDLHVILFIRFVQGFSLALSSIVIPVLIGEYASPKYRGAFLTTMSLGISFGVLSLHSIGLFFPWRVAAAFACAVALVNTGIALLSPESPSYYAARGKRDKCREAFHWLRHPDEEDELERMIAEHASEPRVKAPLGFAAALRNRAVGFVEMWKKKEFYKPIVIIFHLHIINEWSLANVFDAYTSDIFDRLVGQRVDISLTLLSTDALRAASSMVAVIFIRKFRRRVMLFATITCNILSYVAIIVYSYAKTQNLLPCDHPWIGKILLHVHVLTFTVGNLTMPNILAGEMFAFEHRGVSNMFAQIFFCVNYIACTKTAPLMLTSLGLHGTFMVYAAMVGYGLTVAWCLLPETKDRTLQEIEEDFRGPTSNGTNVELLNRLLMKQC